MGSHRVSRLNEQLRREITDIVRQVLRDPRIGQVTVTDVRITADLDFARVYITTMDDASHTEETLAGLRAAAPFIRGELGRRLRIRHTPELRFQLDEALAYARRIESLLAQVRAQEQQRVDAGGNAGVPGERGSGAGEPS